ncbi:MAG: carbohydrate-binding family 9-like protein [Aliidongia sp.]
MRWTVRLSLLASLAFAAPVAAAPVLDSRPAEDAVLSTDPDGPFWQSIAGIVADGDTFGTPRPELHTEIRSRWSAEHLYLLFICRYDRLNLKPDPDPAHETPHLWDWDVAEAFIAGDPAHLERYREFELSPQGEWVDLAIDPQVSRWGDPGWNSGFTVAARIDAKRHIWYGAMAIPWSALTDAPPKAGLELRANFFRIQGPSPDRALIAWQATGKLTFHVPEAFGVLRLTGE